MYPYRVFISYSHEDVDAMSRVRARLLEIGARPILDVDIGAGARFNEEIRRQISYSHVFVSLLTSNSSARPWVHQEIGYALGLGIAVLPLAVNELPRGMAEEIQAVCVRPDLSDLPERLSANALDDAVARCQKAATATFECAERRYQRTQALVGYAQSLLRAGPARVRQRTAWTSFSIPARQVTHRDWDDRDGLAPQGHETREQLRQERLHLEQHARAAGCDLIFDPHVGVEVRSTGDAPPRPDPGAARARLRILREFLDGMPDDKVRAVVQRGRIHGSLIAIGDWVVAEAAVPHYKHGYLHTVFTRHAPTVLSRIQEFDRDLEEGLRDEAIAPLDSRRAAIAEIDRAMGRFS